MLEGALKGRGAKPAKAGAAVLDRPVDGDVVVLGDGGNNPAPLLHHFKQTTRDSASFPTYLEDKKVAVMFSEASMRSRKMKLRGPLEQLQSLYLISSNSLEKMIPEKNFSTYPVSNRGSVIGYVHDSDSPWQLSVEKKKHLYGPDHLVGGTGPLAKDDSDKRRPDDIEPVFYRSFSQAMWLDFVNSYCCAACLDLCAGPGELAKACLLAKKSYVGVCLTALHCDLLKHHLIEWMMQSMATEGTPFYKSEWADAKKQRDGGKASQSTSTTGTGEGKPKADPKAKATGKKSKKEVESSASESQPKKKQKKTTKGKKRKASSSSDSDS